MKTIFILSFILLLLSFNSHAQQTIDKLNANQLKLPKESTNRALILDGAGQVKSSSTITDTELGYLEGLSDTLVNLLSGKANDADVVKLSGNQSVEGIKTFEGKLVASSTVNGSIPCPVMTEVQRDAFTPVEGDCVYNSDTLKINVFDGSVWKDVGGAGGISLWLTANPYNVNDIIIESDKIYRCLIAHTSSLFSAELALNYWVEVSSGLQSPVSLIDGGTGTAIVPIPGSFVYVDSDSFEQVLGSQGQFLQSNGANPPTFVNPFISAKASNGIPVGLEEIQVPNNLLTETGSNKHLNETGNKNILSNPSFENYTFSNSWVNSGGTFTQEDFIVIDGLKAAKLVLSSETMSLSQSSTLYQAQFADGVQGLASVRVKSDVALKVCSVQAGVVSTTNCVDVQANNKWGLYKVPMILGATSNGISIASNGAVSGTVYIDDSFVGPASLTQNMNACNDASCETEFSASISSTGVVSNENLEWITGNATVSGGASNVYTLSLKTGLLTVAPNCSFVHSGNNSLVHTVLVSSSSTTITVASSRTDNGAGFAGPFQIICQKQGADFTAAKQLSNGNTYSSTNADTDWNNISNVSAGTFITATTTNPTYGTVQVNKAQWKRHGSDLLLRWDYRQSTAGTAGSGQYLINIPAETGCVIDTTKAPTSTFASPLAAGKNSNVGTFYYGDNSNDGLGQVFPFSATQLGVAFIYTGASSNRGYWSSTTGGMSVNPQNLNIDARIPCVGWENSNIIIGQFNGLESCTDTLECSDTFSAKISATGVVSDENVDWINGNASVSTSTYTALFNSGIFTVTPNCVLTVIDSLPAYSEVKIINANSDASQIQYFTGSSTGSGGFSGALGVRIICQKQGVDYIGKTAKAVASDQSVRSIGSTGMDIQSVYFGSGANCATACTAGTCTICSQVGSKITSVTFSSTGIYRLNGIDGIKYNCNGTGAGTSYTTMTHRKDASTTSYAAIYAGSGGGVLNSAHNSVTCIGIP